MSVIEDLKTRHAEAQREFERLASSLAADESVDPQEATSIVHAAGKSPDQLELAVAKQRRIAELQAIASRRPELERERQTAIQAGVKMFEALKAERQRLQERIGREEGDHLQELRLLDARLQEVTNAERELRALTGPTGPKPEPAPSFRYGGHGPVEEFDG